MGRSIPGQWVFFSEFSLLKCVCCKSSFNHNYDEFRPRQSVSIEQMLINAICATEIRVKYLYVIKAAFLSSASQDGMILQSKPQYLMITNNQLICPRFLAFTGVELFFLFPPYRNELIDCWFFCIPSNGLAYQMIMKEVFGNICVRISRHVVKVHKVVKRCLEVILTDDFWCSFLQSPASYLVHFMQKHAPQRLAINQSKCNTKWTEGVLILVH